MDFDLTLKNYHLLNTLSGLYTFFTPALDVINHLNFRIQIYFILSIQFLTNAHLNEKNPKVYYRRYCEMKYSLTYYTIDFTSRPKGSFTNFIMPKMSIFTPSYTFCIQILQILNELLHFEDSHPSLSEL